jgi:hypothetical protein
MQPWTLAISTLRKQGVLVFTRPPAGSVLETAVLSGPFI